MAELGQSSSQRSKAAAAHRNDVSYTTLTSILQ